MRLAPQRDPAVAHLGVNGQYHLWQLHLADAVIEIGVQLGDLGVFIVGRQRRQVQFVVHAQHAGPSSLGHGVHASAYARQQRRQEMRWRHRQRQPRVVALAIGLPALGRDEQAFPATERQAVLDPN